MLKLHYREWNKSKLEKGKEQKKEENKNICSFSVESNIFDRLAAIEMCTRFLFNRMPFISFEHTAVIHIMNENALFV